LNKNKGHLQEKPSSSEKIFNLDNQANKLGMGGKLSPDIDESSYKKRMQQRKDIQAERLQIRKTKKGLFGVLDKVIKTSSRIAITISEKI